jgi:hypothetical protein
MNRVAKVAVAVGLLVSLAWYGQAAFVHWAVGIHKQGAALMHLRSAYADLCAYRRAHGRWPQRLDEAANWIDPASQLPFLYDPKAGPGTTSILVAQPAAQSVGGLWPFGRMERLAVRADGSVVDLEGGSRVVARLEFTQCWINGKSRPDGNIRWLDNLWSGCCQ